MTRCASTRCVLRRPATIRSPWWNLLTTLASCHTLRHLFATHIARCRLQHSNGPGAAGAQRRPDHHDLYARFEQGWPWRPESRGPPLNPASPQHKYLSTYPAIRCRICIIRRSGFSLKTRFKILKLTAICRDPAAVSDLSIAAF